MMNVYVNDGKYDLLPGMTVRHALVAAGLLEQVGEGKSVYDQWGNQIGLDGALSAGDKIYVR